LGLGPSMLPGLLWSRRFLTSTFSMTPPCPDMVIPLARQLLSKTLLRPKARVGLEPAVPPPCPTAGAPHVSGLAPLEISLLAHLCLLEWVHRARPAQQEHHELAACRIDFLHASVHAREGCHLIHATQSLEVGRPDEGDHPVAPAEEELESGNACRICDIVLV
jgi:hypothetical protein